MVQPIRPIPIHAPGNQDRQLTNLHDGESYKTINKQKIQPNAMINASGAYNNLYNGLHDQISSKQTLRMLPSEVAMERNLYYGPEGNRTDIYMRKPQ